MPESRESYVREFWHALDARETFEFKTVDKLAFELLSSTSRIRFVWERYVENQKITYIATPDPEDRGMHYLLLRHLVGARDVLSDIRSPKNQAAVCNRYFGNLLSGDFSVRCRYEEVKDRFFTLLMELHKLPESDPIRVKAREFDISWMHDLRARETARLGSMQ